MSVSNLLKKSRFLLVAVALALVSTYFIYSFFRADEKKEVERVEILVANQDISIDTRISDEMLKTVTVEKTELTGESLTNRNDVVGKYAASKILVNEAIRKERLRAEEKGQLGPEEREYRLQVDPVTYGGVTPGCHVDVLWYGSVGGKDNKIGGVVYENVKVLSVMNEFEEDVYSISKDKYNKQNARVGIVSLIVSQEQAEILDLLRAYSGKEKAFTLIKYTEKSKPQGKEKQHLDINAIFGAPVSPEQTTTQMQNPTEKSGEVER